MVLADVRKIRHSQFIHLKKGNIMTTSTTPHEEDLSEQIEHAIETVLDLGNPPHELDSATGAPFVPDAIPAEGIPVVTDAELEKQALAHPGSDGNPATPE